MSAPGGVLPIPLGGCAGESEHPLSFKEYLCPVAVPSLLS